MTEPSEEALKSNLMQFYSSLAPIYDFKYSNPSIDYMRKVERSAISKYTGTRKMKILDLGCGTGSSAIELAEMGHEVVGVDISPEMIAIAHRKAADLGVESCARFLVANIEHLPPLSDTFDLVLSAFGALNHVRDLKGTFKGLARSLPIGSPFVFSLANGLSRFSGLGNRAKPRASWKKLEMREVGKAVWTRFYTCNEVRVALTESGFRPVHVAGIFYLVNPSYTHSDVESLSAIQTLMAKVESLTRWHSPVNCRAAYLLFVTVRSENSE